MPSLDFLTAGTTTSGDRRAMFPPHGRRAGDAGSSTGGGSEHGDVIREFLEDEEFHAGVGDFDHHVR